MIPNKNTNICFKILLVISVFMTFFLIPSCTKEKMPFDDPSFKYETDSVKDIDGNVYKTVKIGDQWWMAENLRVRHYRNNVPVGYNQSMPDSQWMKLQTGAYCYLYNSPVPYNGMLYNWQAVNGTNGIAPDGWHVPTNDDWIKLEIFLGMNSDVAGIIGWRGTHEGEKMKSPITEYLGWKIDQNMNNSNESGFAALPGGCRLYNGLYIDKDPSFTGFWWSSSEYGTDQAWYRHLDYKNGGVFRYYAPKSSGYSIRCVKNSQN
jgi:uncharacterized protein (TIGR02145 family)